jgi:hypothetical protein
LLQPIVFTISVFSFLAEEAMARLFGLDPDLMHVAAKLTNYQNPSSHAGVSSAIQELMFSCESR